MAKKSVTHQIVSFFWSIFLNGLITILPLTLTVSLFVFSLRILLRWIEPINHLVRLTFLRAIPYSEIILVIICIFIVGALLKIFILRTVIHAVESVIVKIPLVRPVYTGMKQLVHAFNVHDKKSFKQVVLVEFPRAGMYSIGFLTSEIAADIVPDKKAHFYNVFIPTTPNPTTGFFIMVAQHEIHAIDLTRQEAMSMIISGGIIQPERMKENHE